MVRAFDLERGVSTAVLRLAHSLCSQQWVNHRLGKGNGGCPLQEHLLKCSNFFGALKTIKRKEELGKKD